LLVHQSSPIKTVREFIAAGEIASRPDYDGDQWQRFDARSGRSAVFRV
jgi:hypothetical protein